EIIDMLYGDRADGGPENTEKSIDVVLYRARIIAAALSIAIWSEYRGWRAAPVGWREAAE
ncbi:MAG TPA: hypothetical protein VKU03_10580, partial [Roseiarcus sp.]|nr:hypothetical protein [Roseiarcus sp.]